MKIAPIMPIAILIAIGTFHLRCVVMFSPLLVYIRIFRVRFFLSRLRTFCDKNGRGKRIVYSVLCLQLTFILPYDYARTRERTSRQYVTVAVSIFSAPFQSRSPILAVPDYFWDVESDSIQ